MNQSASTQSTGAGRRWLRRMGIALVIVIVIVLAAAIYFQSTHAIQHVYLPMAGRTLGGELSAEGGALNLAGRLQLDNPVLLSPAGEQVFSAERVLVDLVPSSLFRGGLPHFEEIRLLAPRIALNVNEQGQTNWDFLFKKEEEKPESPRPFPSLWIRTLNLSDFVLNYQNDAEGVTGAIEDADLLVENLQPGQTGQYELALKGNMKRPAAGIEERLDLNTTGTLRQGSAGLELEWDSRLGAQIESQLAAIQEELSRFQQVHLDGEMRGLTTPQGKLEMSFEMNAATPEAAVGDLNGNVNWEGERRVGEARIQLAGLSSEFLNPFLAATTPIQLVQATVDAELNVNGTGDSINYNTRLDGNQMQFKLAADQPALQPMSLTIQHEGTVMPGQNELKLDMLQMTLTAQGVERLNGGLSQPVTLRLGQPGEAEAETNVITDSEAIVRFDLSQLNPSLLAPWMNLVGVPLQEHVEAGTLDGVVELDIAEQGRAIGFNADLSANDLQLTVLPKARLTLQPKLNGQLTGLNQLDLAESRIVVLSGNKSLLETGLSGNYALADNSGEFTISLQSEDPLAALNTFELAGDLDQTLTGLGPLQINQTVALSPEQPLSIDGKASLTRLQWAAMRDEAAPMSFSCDYNISLAQDQSLLTLKPVRMTLSSPGGGTQAYADIEGQWPLAPDGQAPSDGRLTVDVPEVDLAPWLRSMQALAGETIPPIPFSANEQLTRLANGGVRLEGELRLGLQPEATGEGEMPQISMSVRNELEKIGNQLKGLLVHLTSTVGTTTQDSVRIQGTGQLTDIPQFDLSANIQRLNVDPYLAWLDRLQADQPTPVEDKAPSPPNLRLIADWQVGEAAFKDTALRDAAGTMTLRQGELNVHINRGKLAEGDMQGAVSVDLAQAKPHYQWNLNLERSNLSPLMQSLNATMGGRVAGSGSVDSRGSGRGFGKMHLSTIQSTNQFEFNDVTLENMAWMTELARVTDYEQFRDLTFEHFDGRLEITDGRAQINDWVFRGEENKIGLSGWFSLDGTYRLVISPSLKEEMAEQLGEESLIAGLISDGEGFLPMPLDLVVKGQGADYSFATESNLSVVNQPIQSGKQLIEQGVRDALGDLLE